MGGVLQILNLFSSLWMTIGQLNMLVAIMANRQLVENENETRSKMRYQLSLIVDFWAYNPF